MSSMSSNALDFKIAEEKAHTSSMRPSRLPRRSTSPQKTIPKVISPNKSNSKLPVASSKLLDGKTSRDNLHVAAKFDETTFSPGSDLISKPAAVSQMPPTTEATTNHKLSKLFGTFDDDTQFDNEILSTVTSKVQKESELRSMSSQVSLEDVEHTNMDNIKPINRNKEEIKNVPNKLSVRSNGAPSPVQRSTTPPATKTIKPVVPAVSKNQTSIGKPKAQAKSNISGDSKDSINSKNKSHQTGKVSTKKPTTVAKTIPTITTSRTRTTTAAAQKDLFDQDASNVETDLFDQYYYKAHADSRDDDHYGSRIPQYANTNTDEYHESFRKVKAHNGDNSFEDEASDNGYSSSCTTNSRPSTPNSFNTSTSGKSRLRGSIGGNSITSTTARNSGTAGSAKKNKKTGKEKEKKKTKFKLSEKHIDFLLYLEKIITKPAYNKRRVCFYHWKLHTEKLRQESIITEQLAAKALQDLSLTGHITDEDVDNYGQNYIKTACNKLFKVFNALETRLLEYHNYTVALEALAGATPETTVAVAHHSPTTLNTHSALRPRNQGKISVYKINNTKKAFTVWREYLSCIHKIERTIPLSIRIMLSISHDQLWKIFCLFCPNKKLIPRTPTTSGANNNTFQHDKSLDFCLSDVYGVSGGGDGIVLEALGGRSGGNSGRSSAEMRTPSPVRGRAEQRSPVGHNAVFQADRAVVMQRYRKKLIDIDGLWALFRDFSVCPTLFSKFKLIDYVVAITNESTARNGDNTDALLATTTETTTTTAFRRSYVTADGRTIKLTLPSSSTHGSGSGSHLISPTTARLQQDRQTRNTISKSPVRNNSAQQLRKEAMASLISFQSFHKLLWKIASDCVTSKSGNSNGSSPSAPEEEAVDVSGAETEEQQIGLIKSYMHLMNSTRNKSMDFVSRGLDKLVKMLSVDRDIRHSAHKIEL